MSSNLLVRKIHSTVVVVEAQLLLNSQIRLCRPTDCAFADFRRAGSTPPSRRFGSPGTPKEDGSRAINDFASPLTFP
eukprot:1175883-Prorocentrum_minimum.AAC.5